MTNKIRTWHLRIIGRGSRTNKQKIIFVLRPGYIYIGTFLYKNESFVRAAKNHERIILKNSKARQEISKFLSMKEPAFCLNTNTKNGHLNR